MKYGFSRPGSSSVIERAHSSTSARRIGSSSAGACADARVDSTQARSASDTRQVRDRRVIVALLLLARAGLGAGEWGRKDRQLVLRPLAPLDLDLLHEQTWRHGG